MTRSMTRIAELEKENAKLKKENKAFKELIKIHLQRYDEIEDSEDETCESCGKVVDLKLESDDGPMLIADCNTCRALCCRACLDTEKVDRCVLCVGWESDDDE